MSKVARLRPLQRSFVRHYVFTASDIVGRSVEVVDSISDLQERGFFMTDVSYTRDGYDPIAHVLATSEDVAQATGYRLTFYRLSDA